MLDLWVFFPIFYLSVRLLFLTFDPSPEGAAPRKRLVVQPPIIAELLLV